MPARLMLAVTFLFCTSVPMVSVALAADKSSATFTTAKEAGPDYQIQGEYTGSIQEKGKEQKVGAQIVALGQGKFALVLYPGGLPGDGWDTSREALAHLGRTEGRRGDVHRG